MKKVRNILIIVLFAIFLIGPISLFTVQEKLHAELPSWITAEDAKYLSGGIKEAKVAKNLSLKGFSSEKLQRAINIELENHIPLRASALLQNASLQRGFISSSNKLFGYDAYPTFFGSDRVYLPRVDALARMPEPSDDRTGGVKFFAKGIDKVANNNPDKQFYLIVADQSDTSNANPASKLVSDRWSSKECVEALMENVPDNVHVVSKLYDDTEEYYKDYYKTDHHWNGFGTLKVYDELQRVCPIANSRDNDSSLIDFPGRVNNGSYAREGLMLLNEPILEPKYDLSDFKVNGKRIPPIVKPDGTSLIQNDAMGSVFDFYATWYGSYKVTTELSITNEAAPENPKALMLIDSFSNSLHWLIGQDYRHIAYFLDMKYDQSGEETLQDRIDASDADAIYFAGNALAYSRIKDNFPNYFSD